VTVLVQLINVPVMLRVWGPELFGEWLVLSAVPTYLLLSDLGFGNVAGTDMTLRVHAGDREGARETLQSTLALVLSTTLLLALVVGLLLAFLPLRSLLHLRVMSNAQARATLLLLSINCLMLLQWSVLLAGFRATGRYARGMMYVNAIRIVEGCGVFLVLAIGVTPQFLAAYMLAVTALGTLWLLFENHRLTPWLPLGLRYARWTRIRQLARPAFAYMAFPACAALSTQGMTLVVGLTLGPLAVAVFNPMRTLSRIALQVTDALKNSAWPELSASFGRNDLAFARRLHRGVFQASFLLAGIILVALYATGPWLFALWTHGRITLDLAAFHVLLLVVLANSMWNASSSVAMSVNRHESMSASYLALSVLSIALAVVLAHPLGLSGVAWGMFLADFGMSLVVLRLSTRILDDPLPQFLFAALKPVELQALVARLRAPRK